MESTAQALTGWDYFVLSAALISIAIGLWKGLIKTVFGLAAWAFAVMAPFLLVPLILAQMADPASLPVPVWLLYGFVFIVVLLLVQWIGSWLAGLMKKAGLGSADRLLGGLLGAGRALLIVAVVAIGASLAGWNRSPSWTQAQSRPLLDGVVTWVQPLLPEKISGIRRV
jgi:membrane protein required for colicin V production